MHELEGRLLWGYESEDSMVFFLRMERMDSVHKEQKQRVCLFSSLILQLLLYSWDLTAVLWGIEQESVT